jgi:hypothetical protein
VVFKLVALDLSGNKTQIMSVVFFDGENWEADSLYDKFILEYDASYPIEIEDIDIRLESIGQQVGLKYDHFKDFEGAGGDGLIALFDQPGKKLRLYGIAFGKTAIILGGGGPKPKNIRAYQQNKKLTYENDIMRKISKILTKAIQEKRINVTENGLVTTDDFVFSDQENRL